jgi:hypothetical protein
VSPRRSAAITTLESRIIVAWHTSRCRVAATMRKSIPTIKPILPKGLAAMFHTDLRWSRRAHQNHQSNKRVSRHPLSFRRENEQSNETSALAGEHAIRSCDLNCSASSSTHSGVTCHTPSPCRRHGSSGAPQRCTVTARCCPSDHLRNAPWNLISLHLSPAPHPRDILLRPGPLR